MLDKIAIFYTRKSIKMYSKKGKNKMRCYYSKQALDFKTFVAN
jgi:hypothetical protein